MISRFRVTEVSDYPGLVIERFRFRGSGLDIARFRVREI